MATGTPNPARGAAGLRVALLLACAGSGLARVLQSPLYSDDMMLSSGSSYDVRPFISGFTTTPGEAVSVTFMGRTYNTTSAVAANPPNTTVDCPACKYVTLPSVASRVRCGARARAPRWLPTRRRLCSSA